MTDARITVKSSGSVTWHGVDAGPLTVHHITRKALVLKAASHKFWSSIGNQSTAATRFYVFAIVSEVLAPGGDKEFTCESVVDFPLRKANA